MLQTDSQTIDSGVEEVRYRKIERKTLISRIQISSFDTVLEEAEATPLQSSSFWVLYVLFRLERKGLLPEDTYTDWMTYNLIESEQNKDIDDQGPGNLWTETE